MTHDDEALMARVAEGDRQAFAQLVNAHLPEAWRIARRVLGNVADAEDAAQEAFARVWTQAASWRPERAGFATWFRRILVNQCLDQLRRQGRLGEEALDVADEPDDPAGEPQAQLLRADASARLQRSVERLPARQRLAVVLCYFEEHSNPQAAALMGIHLKALEGLLVRARAQLRRWLPGSVTLQEENLDDRP